MGRSLNYAAKWIGTRKPSNTIEQESLAEAFFTNQDVLTSQSVLVRESIQNAIDAKSPAIDGPVRMYFKLSETSSDIANKYFATLYPRITAAGLQGTCLPTADEKCRVLLVEDYNTTGLLGDISAEKPKSKTENSFWYFAWARGISGKNEGTRGKNGVGKIVFPRSSKIKSQLIYSVRNWGTTVNQGILFGNALLKIHEFEGAKYESDCRWMQEDENTGEHRPFVSDELIKSFREDWKILRQPDEHGTSIVIPYCDGDFSAQNLVQCIIQDYFVALLDGTVECKVIDFDGAEIQLDSETIEQHLAELDDHLLTRTSKNATEIRALCSLYRAKINDEVFTVSLGIGTDGSANKWGDAQLTDDQVNSIHATLDGGGVVEFKIETLIPQEIGKKAIRNKDWFSVLIKSKTDVNSQAVFAREGILIPAAADRTIRVKDFVTLVTVTSGPLADALGQAEGPSHERWSAEESKFKEKYVKSHGEELIRYVKDSANRVTKLFMTKQNELEDSLFAKWFPKTDDTGSGTRKKPGKNPRTTKPGQMVDGFRYEKIDSGFKILPSAENPAPVGSRAIVKAGYSQLFGGSPLSLSSDDFDLQDHQGSLIGVEVIKWNQNQMEFKITQKNFEIRFKNFDKYRDITVGVSK